jgi:hypothetical protein
MTAAMADRRDTARLSATTCRMTAAEATVLGSPQSDNRIHARDRSGLARPAAAGDRANPDAPKPKRGDES